MHQADFELYSSLPNTGKNDEFLPRQVPMPTPALLSQPKPAVPEVSLLFDMKSGSTQHNQQKLMPNGSTNLPSPLHSTAVELRNHWVYRENTDRGSVQNVVTPKRSSGSGTTDSCCSAVHTLLEKQNEQLLQLQKQVEKLLQNQTAPSPPQPPANNLTGLSNIFATVNEGTQTSLLFPSGEVLRQPVPPSKVDAATSDTWLPEDDRLTKCTCKCNCQKLKGSPSMQSHQSTKSYDWDSSDVSLTFNGMQMATVHEPPSSPPASIHLDLANFSQTIKSPESTELHNKQQCAIRTDKYEVLASPPFDKQHQEEPNRYEGQWTMYNNIMGQVKKFLDVTEEQSVENGCESYSVAQNRLTCKEMAQPPVDGPLTPAIKYTQRESYEHRRDTGNTNKEHVKSLGVSFLNDVERASPFSRKHRDDFDSVYVPRVNYISSIYPESDGNSGIEIDALELKYLRKDKRETENDVLPERLHYGHPPKKGSTLLQQVLLHSSVQHESKGEITFYGMSSTNLSFATKQYLQKHGLTGGESPQDSYNRHMHNERYYNQNQHNYHPKTDEVFDRQAIQQSPRLY